MKSYYDSAWHHPFAAYVCGAILLLLLARRLPFLHGYLVVFQAILLADATVTGALSPVPMGTPMYTALSVVFIVLGDLRYFVLVERYAFPERGFARTLAIASVTTLVVPLTTGILTRTVPAMQNDRVLYMVYEFALTALTIGYASHRLARADVSQESARFIRRSSRFFATLYVGWALSDVAILAGMEAAHVLRIVPNVLYYGLFLPYVFLIAPSPLPGAVAVERRG